MGWVAGDSGTLAETCADRAGVKAEAAVLVTAGRLTDAKAAAIHISMRSVKRYMR
jgi:hypothetical protein